MTFALIVPSKKKRIKLLSEQMFRTSQAVRPNWAIFEISLRQIFLESSQNVWWLLRLYIILK